MPTLSSKDIEERLSADGNCLLQPPSSVDELLTLLDRIEGLLSKVEQSPPTTMRNALSPLMKALAVEELLKHADNDVKAGVASCISEITRITAPDAPYEDDKMKDVLQLIVTSFENLSDTASRSYEKRLTILETVAKVRSCVIMLDLECDQMIIEMFQHFLNSIRSYHADIIFQSMETIMCLVLDESEDIAPNLLSPILEFLKRSNEAVLPIAKKLAERVFLNCASKIRPYLNQAINLVDASLNDYSEVVVQVCGQSTVADGHSNESCFKDQLAANNGKNEIEETKAQGKNATVNRSLKSTASNGVNEIAIEETLSDANYSKREVDSNGQFGEKSIANIMSDHPGVQKPQRQEDQAQHAPDRKGLAKFSDLDCEKQPEHMPSNQEVSEEDVQSSPGDISSIEAVKKLDEVKDSSIKLSPSTAVENLPSPNVSGGLPDESREKKSGRTKWKENLVKEENMVLDTASKPESKEENVSKAQKQRRLGKRPAGERADKDTNLTAEGKDDSGGSSDSWARSLDEIVNVEDAGKKMHNVSLSKGEDRKKSERMKHRIGKDVLISSAREDHGRDMATSPSSSLKSMKFEDDKEETPRISNKRKQTPGTDKTSDNIEYGEKLVGSKVKVWWPKDRMFYEGVIISFDSAKKKHKVLYSDGDEEVLNLRRERWEFVGDDSVSNVVQSVEYSRHDIISDTLRKRKGASHFDTSSKRKMEDSPRSKLKETAKSGGKSRSVGKVEPKCKDSNSESSGKFEDDSLKNNGRSKKVGGKSHDDSARVSGISKGVDLSKSSNHLKQDRQRTAKSKGKSSQSSKTLSGSGVGMTKSRSRTKESDWIKEKATDSTKSLEMTEGKSPDVSNLRESGSKSVKRRRR